MSDKSTTKLLGLFEGHRLNDGTLAFYVVKPFDIEPVAPFNHILPVPYLSQWGTGADERRGDCGPASVAMLVHFLTSHRPSVDQVADACDQPSAGAGSRYTGHAQLRKGAARYGVRLETRSPYTERAGQRKLDMALILDEIDAGRPCIALVHYGVLRNKTNGIPGVTKNQDQTYSRGHWFLAVGYDDSDIIVNDPDFWDTRASDGDHRHIPMEAFDAALGAVAPGCSVGYQGLVVRAD